MDLTEHLFDSFPVNSRSLCQGSTLNEKLREKASETKSEVRSRESDSRLIAIGWRCGRGGAGCEQPGVMLRKKIIMLTKLNIIRFYAAILQARHLHLLRTERGSVI
jgi:hypothetical protein